jgi:hypothetical protein
MAVRGMIRMVDLPWQSTDKRSLETVMFHNVTGLFEMAVCCAKPPYAAILPNIKLPPTPKWFPLIPLIPIIIFS